MEEGDHQQCPSPLLLPWAEPRPAPPPGPMPPFPGGHVWGRDIVICVPAWPSWRSFRSVAITHDMPDTPRVSPASPSSLSSDGAPSKAILATLSPAGPDATLVPQSHHIAPMPASLQTRGSYRSGAPWRLGITLEAGTHK